MKYQKLISFVVCLSLLTFCFACSDSNTSQTTQETNVSSLSDISEYDGPVVVQIMASNVIISSEQLAVYWSAPHVLQVICPSIVHWLEPSDGGSLSMIGQYVVDLDPEAIVEGRWYETDTECCLNSAEYEHLLADPDADFHGIGDVVTYTEPEMVRTAGSFVSTRVPISRSFTVVGIVGEEGVYADSVYGTRHMYALTDSVAEMLGNYDPDNLAYQSDVDNGEYTLRRKAISIYGAAVYRPDPSRENSVQFRCAEDRIYSEEEWYALFAALPCNAGYSVEVTIDSGKNYEVFCDYFRAMQFMEMPCRFLYEQQQKSIDIIYQTYEKICHPVDANGKEINLSDAVREKADAWLEESLARQTLDATIARLNTLDELDDWYCCKTKVPVVIYPLRIEK